MKTKVLAVIPARFASTRLPAKPLADINGKPLIYYVWKAASDSKFIDRLVVATDDERIKLACDSFGAESIMTPVDLPSGSDRVLWTFNSLDIHYDYVLNIQGDEPLITGELLDELITNSLDTNSDVGTIVKKIEDIDELFSHSVVKVVMNKNSEAIYFSRSPIPFQRDIKPTKWLNIREYFKHIGIYLYTRKTLSRFGELPESDLESAEKLEQLRLLEDGAKFYCHLTQLNLIGIDTPEDLEMFRIMIDKDLS
jgi:3-deoxy-manno-octulosonate cytidylyltransferase (CMP-KDO synthetase)